VFGVEHFFSSSFCLKNNFKADELGGGFGTQDVWILEGSVVLIEYI